MPAKPVSPASAHRPNAIDVPIWAALAAIVFIAVIVAGTFPHGPW